LKINTRKFGPIEIDENKILSMPDGLPGFSGYHKFILLEDPNSKPFCWFQSVEDPALSLVVMSPFIFKPDYEIDVTPEDISKNWKAQKEEDLTVYVVINITGEKENKKITANLIGPIIINTKTSEAVQLVISDSKYSYQHNVLEEA
jgi:flagellar assembly factor FliW